MPARLKYGHITTASIASSAPVLAVLDMISYLDVVDEVPRPSPQYDLTLIVITLSDIFRLECFHKCSYFSLFSTVMTRLMVLSVPCLQSLDKIGGVACDANVRLASAALQDLLTNSSGQQEVKELFQLCSAPVLSHSLAVVLIVIF